MKIFKILGIKRLLLFLLLLVLNCIMFLDLYFHVRPKVHEIERDFSLEQKASLALQNDIASMRVEAEQLVNLYGRFEALEKTDFFSVQDRSDAKMFFNLIQKESDVVSALVNVASAEIQYDKEAEKAHYKILDTEISVKIKAFDDIGVYRYVDLVEKIFPGVILLESLDIRRVKNLTSAMLRAIVEGSTLELVTADAVFSWQTMIPEDQVIQDFGNVH